MGIGCFLAKRTLEKTQRGVTKMRLEVPLIQALLFRRSSPFHLSFGMRILFTKFVSAYIEGPLPCQQRGEYGGTGWGEIVC